MFLIPPTHTPLSSFDARVPSSSRSPCKCVKSGQIGQGCQFCLIEQSRYVITSVTEVLSGSPADKVNVTLECKNVGKRPLPKIAVTSYDACWVYRQNWLRNRSVPHWLLLADELNKTAVKAFFSIVIYC